MKTAAIAIALALAVSTLNVLAQDAGGPPPAGEGSGKGGHGRAPGQSGPHLLPPGAHEKLKLTEDQQKQIADLEAEVKAKLEKILTPEQLQQLKQMHPPHHQGARDNGGPGAGGPGGGGDNDGPPKRQRPASE